MTHAPGRTVPAAFTAMSTPGSERSGTTMSVSVKQGGHTSSTIPDEETNVTTTNIYIASPEGANGRNVVAYGVLKALTTKPVVGVGRFTSPDMMVHQIKSGVLDLIGAARPSSLTGTKSMA